MANKPVLFAVDDHPEMLARDRARPAQEVRSQPQRRRLPHLEGRLGGGGDGCLGKLNLRGDPVALFLVDQRMPQTTGVEFLEEAKELYPEARSG